MTFLPPESQKVNLGLAQEAKQPHQRFHFLDFGKEYKIKWFPTWIMHEWVFFFPLPHYSLRTNDCRGIPWLINTFSSPEETQNNGIYFVWCKERKKESGAECPRYDRAHSELCGFRNPPSPIGLSSSSHSHLRSVKYIALSTWICSRPDSVGWKMAFI